MGEFISQAPPDIVEKYGIGTMPRREIGGGCTAWYVVDAQQLPDPVKEFAKLTPLGTVQIPARLAREHGLYQSPKRPDTTPHNFTMGSYATNGNGTSSAEAPRVSLADAHIAETTVQVAPTPASRPLNRQERRGLTFESALSVKTEFTVKPAQEIPFDQQKGEQTIVTQEMLQSQKPVASAKKMEEAPQPVANHWRSDRNKLPTNAKGTYRGTGRYSKKNH